MMMYKKKIDIKFLAKIYKATEDIVMKMQTFKY